MALIAFTRNYTDHSNDTGFQFEFHCDKCGSGHMTAFQTSKAGIASGLLRAASSLFGGLRGAVGAVDSMKDTMRGPERDAAFSSAVEDAKQKFKQCTRCGKWVCPEVCWNEGRSLCETCAPDLAEEAAAAQASVAVEQTWDKARQTNLVENLDMKKQRVAQCPHCGARVDSGKFCQSCGEALAAERFCEQCGGKMSATAKFCPECGHKSG